MRGELQGPVALHAVARPLDADDGRGGLAPQELGHVVVVDHGPGQAPHQQQRHGETRDGVPQVAEFGMRGGTRRLGAEAGVAPDPGAVLALDGVVEDAPAQRRLRPTRVVLNGAGQQLVEAVEARRPVDEVGDRRRLLGVHARRDVDQHQGAHEVGGVGGQSQGRDTAERHADDAAGLGSERADHGRQVAPVADGRNGAVEPAVGVAVPGEVDRQQRPPEGQGHGVPGVGVLGPAVHQHQLGRAAAPEQARDRPAGRDLHVDPAHRGRPVVGQAVLARVLVEQPELVVRHQFRHAHECPIRTLSFSAG